MIDTKFDLATGKAYQISAFVSAIVYLAAEDHEKAKPKQWHRSGYPGRSGKAICEMFCTNWRGFHEQLATTVYNKTRWSFEVFPK